jgi:hypothetical protein
MINDKIIKQKSRDTVPLKTQSSSTHRRLFATVPLMQKWLEVSARKHSGPPCCELCQFQYLRQKKFATVPLMQKWLEVSARKHSGPPCCELCQFQYLRHKKFVVSPHAIFCVKCLCLHLDSVSII